MIVTQISVIYFNFTIQMFNGSFQIVLFWFLAQLLALQWTFNEVDFGIQTDTNLWAQVTGVWLRIKTYWNWTGLFFIYIFLFIIFCMVLPLRGQTNDSSVRINSLSKTERNKFMSFCRLTFDVLLLLHGTCEECQELSFKAIHNSSFWVIASAGLAKELPH